MWTVMASYTTAACPPPVLLPASSVSQTARSSSRLAVAFRSPSAGVRCRRPLTVTCAIPPEKERPPAFSIPPTALLCPVPPPGGKERWDIKEEKDGVTLWLQVPGLSDKDIEVTTGGDVLEIKRKVAAAGDPTTEDAHRVGAFHIRLLMTKDYDAGGVTAKLKDGLLEVTVPKNPKRKPVKLGATGPEPSAPAPPAPAPTPPMPAHAPAPPAPAPVPPKPEPAPAPAPPAPVPTLPVPAPAQAPAPPAPAPPGPAPSHAPPTPAPPAPAPSPPRAPVPARAPTPGPVPPKPEPTPTPSPSAPPVPAPVPPAPPVPGSQSGSDDTNRAGIPGR